MKIHQNLVSISAVGTAAILALTITGCSATQSHQLVKSETVETYKSDYSGV